MVEIGIKVIVENTQKAAMLEIVFNITLSRLIQLENYAL